MPNDLDKHPIEQIYQGIKDDISKLYPRITIYTEMQPRERYTVPCLVIECVSIMPTDDPKTGQVAAEALFEVRSMTPKSADGNALDIEARIMACEIAATLRERQYGPQIKGLEYGGSRDDGVDKHVSNIEVWTNTFYAEIRVGKNFYKQANSFPENGDYQSFVWEKLYHAKPPAR